MIKRMLAVCSMLISMFSAAQNSEGDAVIGLWEPSNGKAHVNITRSGNYFYGRISWLRKPLDDEGKTKVDKHNPDASKRGAPLLGLRLLSGFEYKGNHLWEDGTIYDPSSGKSYKCRMTLKDPNTIEIRGYVGLPAFGRTDVWKRVPARK